MMIELNTIKVTSEKEKKEAKIYSRITTTTIMNFLGYVKL